MELRPAIGEAKALLVEPGRAGAVLGRARPEDAVLLLDLLVADTVVVGLAPSGGDAQFVEDLAGRLIGEELPSAQALRQVADDLPIAARAVRRLNRLVVLDDAPLQVGRRALLLGPDVARQHHVRQLSRLRE